MAHYSDLLNLRDQIRHTPNLITILKVFQKKKKKKKTVQGDPASLFI